GAQHQLLHHGSNSNIAANAVNDALLIVQRQEREAQLLANMTGWDIADIRTKIPFAGGIRPADENRPWWKRLWN
ncbi:DUF2330 domain-containing protein, partial [Enterococcus hirae]